MKRPIDPKDLPFTEQQKRHSKRKQAEREAARIQRAIKAQKKQSTD